MAGSERRGAAAGWDGFGYQAGMFGSHPLGTGEPEQRRAAWKVNGGWTRAAGGPGRPMGRQKQQGQAVSVMPIGGNQSSKTHGTF